MHLAEGTTSHHTKQRATMRVHARGSCALGMQAPTHARPFLATFIPWQSGEETASPLP